MGATALKTEIRATETGKIEIIVVETAETTEREITTEEIETKRGNLLLERPAVTLRTRGLRVVTA